MPSSDPATASEAPKSEATEASQSQKEKKNSAGKQTKESATSTESPKLSGAELKKKAKEEKAARRAQAKQAGDAAPSPVAALAPAQKLNPHKGQQPAAHKRAGSTTMEVRNIPLRGAQKTASLVEMPKEEDKTVEFFRHLYKTRATSIAGASKEVHPAVLALGLQMSNYTICGGCARLVATLQAFKRVSFVLWGTTEILLLLWSLPYTSLNEC